MKYMNETVNKNNQQRENNGFFNVLRKPQGILGGKTKSQRQVICTVNVSRQTKEGLINLYKDLAPNEKTKPINVDLIFNEGLPAFEATIGNESFQKIKKYYGIECKQKKGALRDVELKLLLVQLRTVENAQFYIQGFKSLITDWAAKLNGAPEDMSVMVKAKLVRMFYTIYVGYHYFAHDFKFLYDVVGKVGKIIVDYPEAVKNNNKCFYPEDLFLINNRLAYACGEKGLSYQAISYELKNAMEDVYWFSEIMKFAELEMVDQDQFVSVNDVRTERTLSRIRKIKKAVHPEIGVYPMETFACEEQMRQADFDSLYKLKKILKSHNMEDFKTYEREETFLEEARIAKGMRTYYEVEESDDPNDEYGFCISGETEKKRFINMIDYLTSQGAIIKASDGRECDMSVYMPALKFCEEMGYTTQEMTLHQEFDIAEKIISQDKNGAIKQFGSKEVDAKKLRELLGINEQFEKDELGFVVVPEVCKDPEKIAIQFAITNGYVNSEEDIDMELVRNVVVSGNEENLKKFAAGEIDLDTLKKRVGFEDEFAEMYFNLAKIEIAEIENFLQELKRTMAKSDRMKKHALLIKLYCYLIEGKVKCGPKNKAPKGNKGLKTSNLKALIAA